MRLMNHFYRRSESCDNLTVLSGKKTVKRDMKDDFKEVVKIYKRSPELVECIIIWNYSFQIKK